LRAATTVFFDRVEPAFQRYVVNPAPSRYEIWSLRHPIRRMPRGKILRIILSAKATVVWSNDDWLNTNRSKTSHQSELNLWFADFPTGDWPPALYLHLHVLEGEQRWESRNWRLSVL
jgi:hypothetical protein